MKENCVVRKLLNVIAMSGEFPYCSLSLIGNERELRKRVKQMQEIQTYRNTLTGQTLTCKALTVSGKGRRKTIRISRDACKLLFWTDAVSFYAGHYANYNFRGDLQHIDRSHRVAECIAMLDRAQFSVACANWDEIRALPADTFVLSRGLKMNNDTAPEVDKKLVFTRITGVLKTSDMLYAVYNMRNREMKWNGAGELKIKCEIDCIQNSRYCEAVIFGTDYSCGAHLMEQSYIRNKSYRFSSLYYNIYFIPLDKNGISLLKILRLPDHNNILLDAIFGKNRSDPAYHYFVYHHRLDGKYIYSFVDSNINELYRFKDSVEFYTEYSFTILCLEFQYAFIKQYFAGIKNIEIKILHLQALVDYFKKHGVNI